MMNRKRKIALILLGAAVSMLLGSGLLALASDSVRSEGNSVQSGTFTPPSHDLKAARVTSSSECDTATYSDGPFTGLIENGQITLGTALGSSASQEDFFCLRNDGTTTGFLEVSFQSVVDREAGACEASESTAGDTSCADGEAGELKPLLFAQFNAVGGTSGCGGVGVVGFASYESNPKLVDADVAPGATCILWMTVSSNLTSSNTEYLVAQTDRVEWDIVFTLADQTA
jgi:hypothetical protein